MYVLYWMQQAQRLYYNPALQYAITRAKETGIALLVAFVIMDNFFEAESGHYRFMLEGLGEISQICEDKGLDFRIYSGDAVEIIHALGLGAGLVVFDHGCLKWQRAQRQSLKNMFTHTQVVEIETETVVPVYLASGKEEYSAGTLRKKLLQMLPEQLVFDDPPFLTPARADCNTMDHQRYQGDPAMVEELMQFAARHISRLSKGRAFSLKGGYKEAKRLLKSFCAHKLVHYSDFRNHPEKDFQSEMSPYLHFGQISPLDIIDQLRSDNDAYALRALLVNRKTLTNSSVNLADFLEELIVRRELSWNYCTYNEDYDSFDGLPAWAKASLLNHLPDTRERNYTPEVLENAETADVYWNAAQNQLRYSGKMHNYMRMYWGKRAISWFQDPEVAFHFLLYLNNKYSLDGRDANSYAGVAWCFGKHDRPWAERPIYGMVRYMNDKGLERKYNMKSYMDKVTNGDA